MGSSLWLTKVIIKKTLFREVTINYTWIIKNYFWSNYHLNWNFCWKAKRIVKWREIAWRYTVILRYLHKYLRSFQGNFYVLRTRQANGGLYVLQFVNIGTNHRICRIHTCNIKVYLCMLALNIQDQKEGRREEDKEWSGKKM